MNIKDHACNVLAVFGAATLIPIAAHATITTVTFDDLGSANQVAPVTSVTESGLTFTSSNNQSGQALDVLTGGISADPSGSTLANADYEGITHITASTPFTFIGFDAAPFYNDGLFTLGGSLSVTYLLAAGGSQSQTFTFDEVPGLQHFTPGVTDLLSGVDIQGIANIGQQIDNVSVNFGSPTATPEATTWAMMVIGFGAIGATLRRRRVGHERAPVLA